MILTHELNKKRGLPHFNIAKNNNNILYTCQVHINNPSRKTPIIIHPL